MPKALEKREGQIYVCGDCVLSPYPTPSILAKAYLMMEADDLLDTVFYEGVPDIGWFINTFTKANAIHACWVKSRDSGDLNKDVDLAGLTWFNATYKIGRSDLRKSEVGICFLKRFWRRRWTLPLAAMSTEWAFDHLGVYTLIGSTPEPNRAACAFIKRLGFVILPPLPAYTTYPGIEGPVGIQQSYMTKPLWEQTRKLWFV